MVFPGEKFISFSEVCKDVPVVKICGLTKKFFVPGWRMGWMVTFGKPGVMDEVKKGFNNILNVVLMPNTIV